MRPFRIAAVLLGALLLLGTGFWLGRSDTGRAATRTAHQAAVAAVVETADLDTRHRVLLENPEIIEAVKRGGGFGGDFSPLIGQNMFSRDPEVIEEARSMTRVEEIAPRTWLIRMPIVNAVLFETDDGLVLVDAGMAPGGPAVLDAIRKVSDAPLRVLIYTHGHVDHAFGAWALVEHGESPEVVAHEAILPRFERYIRLRGSIAGYMSQPVDQLPASRDDVVWPTQTFRDRLELEVGGEKFVLVHHKGETDDQLYVWVPGRGALASADYYQGFLPNAGNGKRVQRYVEEWAVALEEMAALEPKILLPAHGEAMTDPVRIQRDFRALAEAFRSIVEQTIAGLNSGMRKDQVAASVKLPEHLADDPTLREQYVSVEDVSKMVIRRYTGWWDDLPSGWSPVQMEAQAQTIVELAGGIDALVATARARIDDDVKLACHLADWAWLAAPDQTDVQQLVIDVYRARILDEDSNTQEMLAYIDAMTAARRRQLEQGD